MARWPSTPAATSQRPGQRVLLQMPRPASPTPNTSLWGDVLHGRRTQGRLPGMPLCNSVTSHLSQVAEGLQVLNGMTSVGELSFKTCLLTSPLGCKTTQQPFMTASQTPRPPRGTAVELTDRAIKRKGGPAHSHLSECPWSRISLLRRKPYLGSKAKAPTQGLPGNYTHAPLSQDAFSTPNYEELVITYGFC